LSITPQFLTLAKRYCELYKYKRDTNSRTNFCLQQLPIFSIIIQIRAKKQMKKIETELINKEFIIDDLKITPCKQFE
jgi:hypothetical protein